MSALCVHREGPAARAAGLFLLASLAWGCPPAGTEPVFPADYAASYVEVRDCRRSPEHDLAFIRIVTSPDAAPVYEARAGTFAEGAVIVKEEFADPACSMLEGIEVYAQNTPSLSYEDEWVGEFCSDDLLNLSFSPGVRFLAIGNQVLEREKSNLETAIWMTALVGTSSNDAGVPCWNSKYHYNVERPESYIKRIIDPTWEPNLYNPLTGDEGITPSFPAYPSGHSTMGAAGAEALGFIFGYNYGMTDNCHRNRTEFEGTPRTFSSFEEMALENAWSRVPLGVHFRMDCEEGVRYGKEIGRAAHRLPWKK